MFALTYQYEFSRYDRVYVKAVDFYIHLYHLDSEELCGRLNQLRRLRI